MRKHLTLEEMQKLAESRGGKCLSTVYINNATKLQWQCKHGHRWESAPANVLSGNWCPLCAGNIMLTIEGMHKIAMERGGYCLSERYRGMHKKLKWKCDKGHVWEAQPSNVKNGTWCPYCIGRHKTIEDLQRLAKERGGECLSVKYLGGHKKHKWKCKQGHDWNATPHHILLGTWCPQCAFKRVADKKKLSIDEMQILAERKGGKCLSKNYIDNRTDLKWQCKEGHIWEATPRDVKSHSWCPYCAKNVNLSIEEMQKLARIKEGKCLSKKYVSIHTKLRWQCKERHIWEAQPSSIRSQGTWCPICSTGISERVCRKIFELIFNERFPKRKPTWLVNSKGNRLELDGYCKKLGIAFEYQGRQHYVFSRLFSKDRDVNLQQEYDKLKKQLCDQHNIILIQVPYTINFEKMPEYIIQKCKDVGIKIPKITKSLDYKLMNIYSPQKIKEMQELAIGQGGKCLSKNYVNSETKLRWQCKERHIWEATPRNVKHNRTWCPYCVGKRKTESRRNDEL